MFTNWKLREELNQEVYFKIQMQKNTYLQEIRIAQLSSILCNKHLSINFQPKKKKKILNLCPRSILNVWKSLKFLLKVVYTLVNHWFVIFLFRKGVFFNKGNSNLNRPTRFKLTALKAHASTEKTYSIFLKVAATAGRERRQD